MPYASVAAGLVAAANISAHSTALNERRAAVLKTRRAQMAQAESNDHKHQRRQAAIRRKANNQRAKARCEAKQAALAAKYPTVRTEKCV